jgi:hypothetical protein
LNEEDLPLPREWWAGQLCHIPRERRSGEVATSLLSDRDALSG